jgi:hypothetical protein
MKTDNYKLKFELQRSLVLDRYPDPRSMSPKEIKAALDATTKRSALKQPMAEAFAVTSGWADTPVTFTSVKDSLGRPIKGMNPSPLYPTALLAKIAARNGLAQRAAERLRILDIEIIAAFAALPIPVRDAPPEMQSQDVPALALPILRAPVVDVLIPNTDNRVVAPATDTGVPVVAPATDTGVPAVLRKLRKSKPTAKPVS